MFKKNEDLGNVTQVNKSTQRFVRNSLIENFPLLEEYIDEVLPKKATLWSAKLKSDNKVEIIFYEGVVFGCIKDKILIPSLRIVHKWGDAFTKMRVDKGGIKFVMGGANVMAPGLLNPGGEMDEVEAGKVVTIHGEGKEFAMAVGVTKFSTAEIRQMGKGIVIDTVHFLGDTLWHMKAPKGTMGKSDDK